VKQFPVSVAQPEEGLSIFGLKKSTIVRYTNLGDRGCGQED
jgi:hypothetical protein